MSEAMVVTNEFLKSILEDVLVRRTAPSHIDDIRTTGIYFIDGTMQGLGNLPSGAKTAVLIAIQRFGNVFHLLLPIRTEFILCRSTDPSNSQSWISWKKFNPSEII